VNEAAIGQGASVTAVGSATVNEQATTNATTSAAANGQGFGAGAYANIVLQIFGNGLSEVDAMAHVSAANVVLSALTNAALFSSADALAAGFGAGAYATSSIIAMIDPTVLVGDQAVIKGTQSVEAKASNGAVIALNVAHTTTEGVFAYSTATTNGLLLDQATLVAPNSAQIVTPSLKANALTGVVLPLMNLASQDKYAIDAGSAVTNATFNITPIYSFSPMVSAMKAGAPHRGSFDAAPPQDQAQALDASMQPDDQAAELAQAGRDLVFDDDLGVFIPRRLLASEAVLQRADYVRYGY